MFVDVQGQRLHVAAFGAGPRTLLGLGPWTFGWQVWQPTLEILSTTWRAVAYDGRGAGESPAPPETITRASLIGDVFGVMDALGIERCVLGADSASSLIALAAVLERPERFEGLVLAGGIASPRPGWDDFTAAHRADPDGVLTGFLALCFPGENQGHVRRWGLNFTRTSDPLQATQFFLALQEHDLAPRLPEIAVPTLIIHGAADLVVPVATAEEIAGRIPQSRLVVLPGGDHGPTMSAPTEVAAAINDYFR